MSKTDSIIIFWISIIAVNDSSYGPKIYEKISIAKLLHLIWTLKALSIYFYDIFNFLNTILFVETSQWSIKNESLIQLVFSKILN